MLDKMNKSYNNIEYLRISGSFINYLIKEKYFNILCDGCKIIKIYINDNDTNDYEYFITSFKKIKNYLKPKELTIKINYS